VEQYEYIKEGDKLTKFRFLRVPREIFGKANLSLEAKVLYAIMLDYTDLALKIGQVDQLKRAYITYSNESVCRDLGVSLNTARKRLRELQDAGLLIKQVDIGGYNIYYILASTDIIH